MEEQVDIQLVLDDLRRQLADKSIELAIANARIASLLKKVQEADQED